MNSPLKTILDRGHTVEVENGKLSVTGDTSRYTSDWYRRYSKAIIKHWSKLTDLPIYSFIGFTVGNYEYQKAGRSIHCPGCRLQLFNVVTGEEVAAIFNVVLKYSKSTKCNSSGAQYKGKRFRVTRNHALYRLWLHLGLPEPRRPSELYKGLGKLNGLFVTAKLKSPGKLDNSSITSLHASSHEILRLAGGREVADKWQGSGKQVASVGGNTEWQGQVAKAGGKHSAVASVTQGVRPNLKCVSNHASVDVSTDDQSTSLSKYELSNQVMKDKEPPSNSVKKAPQEQTNDEWLQDYDNAS
ncbi:hypothetical protein [Alteromonas lipotrueiana]|uniref:hypothetical protein n=1 Tax=Alteromonas lipotrueiana TaxID=2803815 RepID=UPI001C44B182|nr:hypothetical protein [Alteromonas lipotrueiana]